MKSLGLRSKKSKSKTKEQRRQESQNVPTVVNVQSIYAPRRDPLTGDEIFSMPPEPVSQRFPTHPYPPSSLPAPALIEITPEEAFRKMKISIQENLKKYQETLADFILTHSESSAVSFDEFHKKQKQIVLTDFTRGNHTYLESSTEQVFSIALQAHAILEVQLDSHFASYVKPTEKDSIVRNHFFRFRDEALSNYCQNMKKVDSNFETSEETRGRHEHEKQNALQYLDSHFQLYGWDITTDWRSGLLQKIEEEFQANYSPAPSVPTNNTLVASDPWSTNPAPSASWNNFSIPTPPRSNTPLPSAPPATGTLLRTLDLPLQISSPGARTISSINIGVYMDEVSMTVGEYNNNNSQHRILIQELPTQIIFTEGEIIIGGDPPQVPPRNYFAIYSLLSKNSSMHLISLGSRSLKISSEEVIAAFFLQLLERVKSSAGVQNVANIVLTFPFLLTSLQKERLKHCLKLAGVYNVRILSSLVTTAVAHAQEILYYPPESTEAKIILAIQYCDKSFSAAIVEIKPESIVPSSVTGSENIIGHDGTFWHCHKFLFTNNPRLKPEQSNFVSTTYRTAMERLYADARLPRTPDQVILIKKTRQKCLLHDLILSFFGTGVKVQYINEGPLLGASLVASSVLPVSVLDASRADIVLTNKETQRSTVIPFHNSPFTPREIFPASMTVPPQGFELVIKEDFCKDKLKASVGVYTLLPQKAGGTNRVKYSFMVDQDGIFNVVTDNPSGVIKRTFGMEGEADVGLPSWRDLTSYYDTLKITSLPGSPITPKAFKLQSSSTVNNPIQPIQPIQRHLPSIPKSVKHPSPTSSTKAHRSSIFVPVFLPELLQQKGVDGKNLQKNKSFNELEHTKTIIETSNLSVETPTKNRTRVPVLLEATRVNFDQVRNNLRHVHTNLGLAKTKRENEITAANVPSNLTATVNIDLIKAVEQMLQDSKTEGLKCYKNNMAELTGLKVPFTENQIQEFHEKNMIAVLHAFSLTYEAVTKADLGVEKLVEEWKEKLRAAMESLLVVYVNRYEETMETVGKNIKSWMVQAEADYSTKMKDALVLDSDEQLFIRYHAQLLHEFEASLKCKFGERYGDSFEIMDTELLFRLCKKYQDFVSESQA